MCSSCHNWSLLKQCRMSPSGSCRVWTLWALGHFHAPVALLVQVYREVPVGAQFVYIALLSPIPVEEGGILQECLIKSCHCWQLSLGELSATRLPFTLLLLSSCLWNSCSHENE